MSAYTSLFVVDFLLVPGSASARIHFLVFMMASCGIGVFSTLTFIRYQVKRFKALLRKSKKQQASTTERLRLAVEASNAGIYEWNLIDNSLYVSEQWKKLLGYSEEDLNGGTPLQLFLSCVHADDFDRMKNTVENHLKTLEPYKNEVRLKNSTGNYSWFCDSGVIKTNAAGVPELVLGSLINIDEHKRSEVEIFSKKKELAKANEELDRFVYSASHDMRAPLCSLLGLIDLSERTSDMDEVRLYLNMMKVGVGKMDHFIREVTDYSRNSRLEIVTEKINLKEAIEEKIRIHKEQEVYGDSITIKLSLCDTLTVQTDVKRLHVVLDNIITNAYRYHNLKQQQPYIMIAAERDNDFITVTVTDNGIGIDSRYLPKVFDMFFRASDKSQGSGLGLYIVRETLKKLGGDIQAKSVLGEGSSFTFVIPDVS